MRQETGPVLSGCLLFRNGRCPTEPLVPVVQEEVVDLLFPPTTQERKFQSKENTSWLLHRWGMGCSAEGREVLQKVSKSLDCFPGAGPNKTLNPNKTLGFQKKDEDYWSNPPKAFFHSILEGTSRKISSSLLTRFCLLCDVSRSTCHIADKIHNQ